MSIRKADNSIDFRQGIDAISYLDRQSPDQKVPAQGLTLYFTGDLVESNLSRIFTRHKGQKLVDEMCKPEQHEYEKLQHANTFNQAIDALDWARNLEGKVPQDVLSAAENVLSELAELHMQQQVQRKLLIPA